MTNRLSIVVFAAVTILAGCSGQAGSVPAPQPLATTVVPPNGIPASYQCFPSNLPSPSSSFSPAIAYMSLCAVDEAKEAANLQKLAVAMMYRNGNAYIEYCTGTPLSYDAKTGIGFVVSAAHCVVGGQKRAGAEVTPANITTFSDENGWIYQSTPARLQGSSALTGQINAVYIPSRYCEVPAFEKSGKGCSDLERQNGDLAVLKVVGLKGNSMHVLPGLKLAPADLAISRGSYIMALGYGTNTSPMPDDRTLYYIDYQYFADDRYKTVFSEASIMNGYFTDGTYYSIICQGDSGGGDFYWDGSHWNLVGAHSWGPNPCGVWGKAYTKAYDVSADLRPWTAFIQRILDEDRSPTGCASLSDEYVCEAR